MAASFARSPLRRTQVLALIAVLVGLMGHLEWKPAFAVAAAKGEVKEKAKATTKATKPAAKAAGADKTAAKAAKPAAKAADADKTAKEAAKAAAKAAKEEEKAAKAKAKAAKGAALAEKKAAQEAKKAAKTEAAQGPDPRSEGAPKQPPSSYMLWMLKNRDAIKKTLDPAAKVTEVAKASGEKWAALAAKVKATYEQKAAKLKEEFEEEKKAFLASGGVMPKRVKKVKKEKKEKDPNAPKRPLSAYMLWLQDSRESIKKSLPGATIPELGREAGRQWQALGEAKKKPYQERAAKATEEYKEKTQWTRK